VLDRLIEVVFKYRPVVFEQGDLGFSPPWPAAVAIVAVALAMGAAVWVYVRSARMPAWSRAALLALRLSALAVFLFALLRPVLVVRTVEPQRNVLAVLVDGSRSMEITDQEAKPRSAFVRDALGPSGALRAALAQRFTIRDYEFASTKPERLLLAGIDYSIHRHVVYVAAKPPRTIFRTIAGRLGRSILYVPIGQLSPAKLKRVRVVHVLDSHRRRDTAREFIW